MADITLQERREASHILGEMAASRLFDLIRERLDELATREGLTQADLAKRLGLKEQQVSRWVTHPRNITVKSAGRLLGALEAYLEFGLERFEDVNAGNHLSTVTISTDGREVARITSVVGVQTDTRSGAQNIPGTSNSVDAAIVGTPQVETNFSGGNVTAAPLMLVTVS